MARPKALWVLLPPVPAALALRPGAEIRSVREVRYSDEVVPPLTAGMVLEAADVEGFLVVEWTAFDGHFLVHASDVEEFRAPVIN